MVSDKQLYVEDFQYILSNGTSGHIKTICPFCHEQRHNKRDKSLSIDRATLAYKCHYCDAKGYLKSKMGETISKFQKEFKPKMKEYVKPQKKQENTKTEYAKSFIEWFKGRCISEYTLHKAKVTQDIEFMPNVGRRIGCIAFNYYVGDELVNVKYRTREKGFKLTSGAKLVPYNINSISEEAYSEDEPKVCLFVEGEMDALTYLECGYEHVVSVPNGANANLEYLDDFIESHFDKLECIYISVDNDRKGLECRAELIRRFGREKCKVVDYPKPCKDINEVLMQYGKNAVKQCVDGAKDVVPEGVQDLVDVESQLDFMFHNGLHKGATIQVPSIDKILSFKTGLLTVVTGIPSHGKTYLLNYMLIRLNLLYDWKVAFFSPEFYPVSLHIAQIIETMGGLRFDSANYTAEVYNEMKEYLCNNMWWIDPDDTDINSVLDRAEYLIKKKGIKVLVIDPFNALTDKERKNQKQDEYISDFLQKLRWFARKYDIALFLVMHPTKMTRLENGLYPVCDLYNCKGASEIFDKADIGLTVWRNEQDDYAELHVTKIKFRHLGEKGHATFKFNILNGRYIEINDADELKKQGIDIKNMHVEKDNRNYIVAKNQHKSIGDEFTLEVSNTIAQNNQYNNTNLSTDVPFAASSEEAPF